MALIRRAVHVMGCDAELLVAVDGAPAEAPTASSAIAALDAAIARLEQLEARWSRFRPDSELSRLNRDGRRSALSADTFALIEDAVEAWRLTDARFDPTVHDALVAAGYDRTIEDVRASSPLRAERSEVPVADEAPRAPVPGPVGIELDPDTRTVVLPAGVHLDLGGIGKGRAADIVATQLRDRLRGGLDTSEPTSEPTLEPTSEPTSGPTSGPTAGSGVCVDLGGDIRVLAPGPDGRPWGIEIEDPFDPGSVLTTVALDEGAVATSARTRRTWQADTGAPVAHHLIDPATGRPSTSGLASVSVIAHEAQWAEVMAKAAFVAGLGLGADLIVDAGLDGILVTDEGWIVRTPGFHRFEVRPPS